MKTLDELRSLLELEKIEENIFRGQNYQAPWKRVFGGQVLAQSLHAAYNTVSEDRVLHSMHGYFILAGDISVPIIYDVDRIRDGGSFTTRRVRAIQKGQTIFITALSFQVEREGLDHQIPMPDVPPPESLKNDTERLEPLRKSDPDTYKALLDVRPIEFRQVEFNDPQHPTKSEPLRHVWLKAKGSLSDSLRLHQEVLAYASDYNLLTTAVLPHLDITKRKNMFFASLDHAMWYHRSFRIDDWLLYQLDSPSASNTRGFTRGNIFSRDGRLVASVTQEGLMMQKR